MCLEIAMIENHPKLGLLGWGGGIDGVITAVLWAGVGVAVGGRGEEVNGVVMGGNGGFFGGLSCFLSHVRECRWGY